MNDLFKMSKHKKMINNYNCLETNRERDREIKGNSETHTKEN